MLPGLAAIVCGLTLGQVPTGPAIRPCDFEGWFRAAERGDLDVPAAVALKASSFRYVFVGGFRNERMPGYFAQNMAELRALGVPRKAIHVINPSSSRTSTRNAEEVRSRFLEVAGAGPEKLVVIAHSRGACDALSFAIANASFVRDRVEALFLIQGPFGGSGVAEYVLGSGTSMDRRMPWRHRILYHLAGKVARGMARRVGLDAVEGMTREASRAFWARILREHADALATVGPRVFYVRSKVEPSKLRFVRRAIAWYVQIYHGPGDGMVALADQMLPELGTVVATLSAAHADLTQRFPASRAPKSMRRALARSIVMAVGQSPPELAEAAPNPVDTAAPPTEKRNEPKPVPPPVAAPIAAAGN